MDKTKYSIKSQKMAANIVKYCTIYVTCSWLAFTEVADLSVFLFLLGQLVEPEIVLMVKDKLRASDLG